MTKITNHIVFIFLLGAAIPSSFAGDPSPTRRKESVDMGNHNHFAKWAEFRAHQKLIGDDRCTKVDIGESMVGEFREPGNMEDLHVLQIKRCSGTRPPIASYWGLYRGNSLVASGELVGMPFFKSMEYVDFPKNRSAVEEAALRGYAKEKGKCVRYLIRLGWGGDNLAVLKLDNDGIEHEKKYKCL